MKLWRCVLGAALTATIAATANAQLVFTTEQLPVIGEVSTSLVSDGTNLYYFNQGSGEIYTSTTGATGSWSLLTTAPNGASGEYSGALAYANGMLITRRSNNDPMGCGWEAVIYTYDIASNTWTDRGLRSFGGHSFVVVGDYLYGMAHAIDTNQGGPITRLNMTTWTDGTGDSFTCDRTGIKASLAGDNTNWFSRVAFITEVSGTIYGIKNDWVSLPPGEGDRLYSFEPADYSANVWTGDPEAENGCTSGDGALWENWTNLPQTVAIDLGNLPVEPGYGSAVVGLPANWTANGAVPLVGAQGGLFIVFGRSDANWEGWGNLGDSYAVYDIATGAYTVGLLPVGTGSGLSAAFHDGTVYIKRGGEPDSPYNNVIWVAEAAPALPPTADAGADQNVSIGLCDLPIATLDGSGSYADLGHSIVSYRWSIGSNILAESTSPTAVVELPLAGATVTLTVFDDLGQAGMDTVAISFTAPTLAAPTADAGADFSVTTETPDGIVTVDGSGSTSDCDLTYSWDLVDGGVTSLLVTDQPVAQVQLPEGVHTVQLTVEDLRGQTAVDQVVITVTHGAIAVDQVTGAFGIKRGDIHGTAQSPVVLPNQNVSIELVDQVVGYPDPTSDRQFVFDRYGNLYYVTWYKSLKSLTPNLEPRWETESLGNSCLENGMIVVGDRYVYVAGPAAVDFSSGGTVYNYGPTIWAFNKLDGSVAWSTELGEPQYTDCVDGRPTMTLLNNKLYAYYTPEDSADALDLLGVYQLDSATGAIDWASDVLVGNMYSRPGHCVIVEDLYGSGLHGLFAGGNSELESDDLSDVISLVIDPTPGTGGATVVWGTDIDAGKADYSRAIYSETTDTLYHVGQWDWAGKQYWAFTPSTGYWDDGEGGYAPLSARGGDYAIGDFNSSAAALSLDGQSIYTGGAFGRLYKYTHTSDGPALADQTIATQEFWYGDDMYKIGPYSIIMEGAAGEELMVTGFIDPRWWNVDPADPTNDARYEARIVLLNLDEAVEGGTDEQLDDGPIYIDNVAVKVSEDYGDTYTLVAFSEDFEGFSVGAFMPQAASLGWEWVGTEGTEDTAQIVDLGGDRGKVLMLDPYGGHGAVTAVQIPMPEALGDDENPIAVNWYQRRVDFADKIFIGEAAWPHGATFQGDGSEAFAPAGKIVDIPGDGSTPASADLVLDEWQEVLHTLDYDFDELDILTGPIGGPLASTGALAYFVQPGMYFETLKFEMTASRTTSTGFEPDPLPVVASYQANEFLNADPQTSGAWDRDWDEPDGLSISPNGDIYYMQFKGYSRRFTHLRIAGDYDTGTLCADANCDGAINAFDIDPFVIALVNQTQWQATYSCDYLGACDINGDGAVNAFDIDPFVVALVSGGCQ